MRKNFVHRLAVSMLMMAAVACTSETDTHQSESEQSAAEQGEDRFSRIELPSAEVFRVEDIPYGDMDGVIRFRDVKGVTTLISHVELDMGAMSPRTQPPRRADEPGAARTAQGLFGRQDLGIEPG